jgi:hypothetical protein
MNPGTAPGFGPGVVAGTISRYIQTPVILTSQTIAVPPGVQRIEALLVGGGGSGQGYNGGAGGGGGFGGAAIIEIPITGSPLQIVIGAGGTINTAGANDNTAGSPTYVVSAGTRYAEVGGGGKGQLSDILGTKYVGGSGRSGGSGGGLSPFSGGYAYGSCAGTGGGPPIGKLLWSIYTQTSGQSFSQTSTSSNYALTVGPTVCGLGGASSGGGLPGCLGAGGGGGYWNGPAPGGGGGQYVGTATLGGGSLYGTTGGSLTSVTVWGFTGFAGGANGGGGGLFGAGSGVTGGLGGGGGGGGSGTALDSGAGGAGAAVIRFYL